MSQSTKSRIKKLIPSLGVADIERAVGFYREFFGFEILDSFEDDAGAMAWCWMRSGAAELMLQQLSPDQQITLEPAVGQSWVMYLRPENIEVTHARLKSAGVEVSDIETTGYGARECFVTDPDGYELWLSEPEAGLGPDDDDVDFGDSNTIH